MQGKPDPRDVRIPSGHADPPYPRTSYAWYVVAVLMVIHVFSFIDRQILGLLVEPIKADLGISDTQMSYLMGFSFALFYTLFGIPIGRLADSKSRRAIIAAALGFWSLMTAGCGIVTRYWHFVLMRMGVGVGEGALSPSAFSLIADYFPKERLATAVSLYSTGIYFGGGLAFVLVAQIIGAASGSEGYVLPLIGEIRPWQVVFFAIGLPGIAATSLLLTVREPIRRGVKHLRRPDGSLQPVQAPLRDVGRYLTANRRTILCHNLGFALLAFSAYGASSWIPAFMIRTHGWTEQRVGNAFGIMIMTLGTLGVLSGGVIADLLARRGVRSAKIWSGFIAAVIWFPFGVAFPLLENQTLVVAALAMSIYCSSMPFGCAAAAIQEVMPSNMRAQASALYLFITNLIGLGLGPSSVAWCTDYLFRDESMVRYSLLIVGVAAHIGSAAFLYAGTRSFGRSLDHLEAHVQAQASA